MPKVAIIDYQMSNLFSVQHACDYFGIDAKITSDKSEILKADGAILPGMGAFGDAMKNLDSLGLSEAIKDFIKKGKPFMGVCLGMQLLLEKSEEFGIHQGLGIIAGEVKKFPGENNQRKKIKIPQIGWNKIYSKKNSDRLNNSPLSCIKNNTFMYFVHSYFVKPKSEDIVLTLTDYEGFTYCSSLLYDNIFATQFHPEKSGKNGVTIYKEWAKKLK